MTDDHDTPTTHDTDEDTHDDTHDDTDEDLSLRARLGRIDPAAALAPADPAQVARLVTDARTDHLDLDVPETRQTGVHDRSRLTWLVAAAAVLLIAGVGALVLLGGDDDEVPVASPGSADTGTVADGEDSGDDPGSDPTQATGEVTVLSAPAGVGSGRCAVPSAEVLSRQTLAFDGTVTDISDGLVTLEPTTFYAGEPTEEVQLQAPQQVLRELILAVSFEEGERYLVSAVEGEVSVCGYSAPWSPELERLYRDAFPG